MSGAILFLNGEGLLKIHPILPIVGIFLFLSHLEKILICGSPLYVVEHGVLSPSLPLPSSHSLLLLPPFFSIPPPYLFPLIPSLPPTLKLYMIT